MAAFVTTEEYRNVTDNIFRMYRTYSHSSISIKCAVNSWAVNTITFCIVPL
jgi:galactose-1-phosphate uridylyltransferase